MIDVTNEQAAYMAGAIDGEGHLGIRRTSPDASGVTRSPRFTFVISITNVNKAWLEQLQAWFGGRLVKIYDADERRRACYNLRFTALEAKALLVRVMPYLVMKQRHANVVLRYFELAAKRKASSTASKLADADTVAEQEALCAELKSLNLTRKVTPRKPNRRAARKCSLDGCETKHYGKGYCWIHYRKFILRGGPSAHEKTCTECGREFVTRRKDANCCSQKCGDRRHYRLNADRIKAQVAEYRKRRRNVAN